MENNPITQGTISKETPDYVDLVQAILMNPDDKSIILAEAPKGTYLSKNDIIETSLGKAYVISTIDYVSTTSKEYDFFKSIFGHTIYRAIFVWKRKEMRWN